MPVQTGKTAKGVAVVEWNGEGVMDEVDAMVSERLDKAAIMVQTTARKSIRAPKTGPKGPKAKRSVAGEAPASQHGGSGLLGSVEYDSPSQLTRRIGTALDYGLYLEMGAANMKTGAILYPRPWLEPALIANKKKIERLFKK